MDIDNEALEAFISAISLNNKIWGLKGPDGWAVCDSLEFEETSVYPFFSSEAAALKLCTEAWKTYVPSSLELEEFLQDWLPGMHEDNALLGIEWNADMEGEEMEPADIAAAFEAWQED